MGSINYVLEYDFLLDVWRKIIRAPVWSIIYRNENKTRVNALYHNLTEHKRCSINQCVYYSHGELIN